MYKTVLLLFCGLVLTSLKITAQKGWDRPFGEPTIQEKEYTATPTDSLSHAVVLYERGDHHFELRHSRIQLIKNYHVLIKILDKEGFKEANISIPLYHNNGSSESVIKIKAIVHNGASKTFLDIEKVYDIDVNERWKEKQFTLGNVKPGSIVEYSYEIASPFYYNFSGWDFQSHLPKLYSEFNAKIPGNYKYNRVLIGSLPLSRNDATIKRECFSLPGYSGVADCEVLHYAMKNVSAINDDEPFMLSADNYRARLAFEMAYYEGFDGLKEDYTKSWKDVDKELRNDEDIGRQMRKNAYFKALFQKKHPNNPQPDLQLAQDIYKEVQRHFVWNGKYGIFRDTRVKSAYENQLGNVAEINLSLINFLKAAGFNVKLVLLSTRNNGLPKKDHPVMSDFNYLIAHVDIDGKAYLLDATEDILPFGMIPFRALNYHGRIMDFKTESHWLQIVETENSNMAVRLTAEIDPELGLIKGKGQNFYKGYPGLNFLAIIEGTGEKSGLEKLEAKLGENFSIEAYKVEDGFKDNRRVSESFTYEFDDLDDGPVIVINPILIPFFEQNPFQAPERNFPVDFGYTRNYKYLADLKLPENYSLESLPQNVSFKTSDGGALFTLTFMERQGHLVVNSSLMIRKSNFKTELYGELKALFQKVTDYHLNSAITLIKK
ncbi:DUF3857 domain-containing protein [Sediminicola luteus]|uniref:DUF3857 domain-containing protein n=1 Tax=Sediminicola luteus TaxID=319238 RepID=A0A2A4G8Y2_9FLAO|nr:DUF3857 domain-containing protein [Sediminicola luteus]PCE64430.1 hypothetical protein B7P33_09075 [Sediminicola luteus]